VIVQPTKANQIVAVTVGLRGSYASGETENPAVPGEMIAITTASGSVPYPRDKYRMELSRLVSTISGGIDDLGVTYTLTCVRPKFDESWKIFSDVIKEPLYNAEEMKKTEQGMLADIAGRRQEPEQWVNFLIDSIWGGGHRSGRITQPADVTSVTESSLRAFHDILLDRSRMTIVIVGDVTRKEVEAKVHSFLMASPAVQHSHYLFVPLAPVSGPGTTEIVSESRSIPTTYIVGRFASPSRRNPDYWPLRLAVSTLSDRLYEEVRTKRNLSYSPYAASLGRYIEYFTQVGVSSTAPDSAMHVIVTELNNLRDHGITEKELRDTKEAFITAAYMSQQSNLAEANRLYVAELETGDYHNALHIVEDAMRVTNDDVQRAVKKYLHTIYWTAVGNQDKVHREDFLYP
jgi:zinc protease